MAKRAKPGELNEKQQRFVLEYLKDRNATQAAIRSGYSPRTAEQQGYRLLRHAQIAAAVGTKTAKVMQRLDLTADSIIEGIARIAHVDLRKAYGPDGELLPIHQIPDEVALALSAIESEDLFEGRGEERRHVGVARKLKTPDRLRAYELLGKLARFGLFVEKHELTGANGGPIAMVSVPLTKEEAARNLKAANDALALFAAKQK